MSRKNSYYILIEEKDLGEITKIKPPIRVRYFTTKGYEFAKKTARLVKKRKWHQACKIANEGLSAILLVILLASILTGCYTYQIHREDFPTLIIKNTGLASVEFQAKALKIVRAEKIEMLEIRYIWEGPSGELEVQIVPNGIRAQNDDKEGWRIIAAWVLYDD